MQYHLEVIAITLIPVRHKRHVHFLTSAPNFSDGLPEPLKRCILDLCVFDALPQAPLPAYKIGEHI